MDSSRSFQQVPVPTEYVTRVMALIAELDLETEGGPSVVSGAVDPPVPKGEVDAPKPRREWTTEELRQLAKGKNPTTKLLTQIMDVLCKSPGTWFTSAELAEAVGHDPVAVKQFWTQVSRHINARYHGAPWPLEAKWGLKFDPARKPLVYYRLNEAQAERWERARSDPEA